MQLRNALFIVVLAVVAVLALGSPTESGDAKPHVREKRGLLLAKKALLLGVGGALLGKKALLLGGATALGTGLIGAGLYSAKSKFGGGHGGGYSGYGGGYNNGHGGYGGGYNNGHGGYGGGYNKGHGGYGGGYNTGHGGYGGGYISGQIGYGAGYNADHSGNDVGCNHGDNGYGTGYNTGHSGYGGSYGYNTGNGGSYGGGYNGGDVANEGGYGGNFYNHRLTGGEYYSTKPSSHYSSGWSGQWYSTSYKMSAKLLFDSILLPVLRNRLPKMNRCTILMVGVVLCCSVLCARGSTENNRYAEGGSEPSVFAATEAEEQSRPKRTLFLKKKLLGAGLLGFGLGIAKGYKAGYYHGGPEVHHVYVAPPPSAVKYVEYVEKPVYIERIVDRPVFKSHPPAEYDPSWSQSAEPSSTYGSSW